MKKEREPTYWSCNPEIERLTHESMEAAVEWHLDALTLDLWPEEMFVYGFARMEISPEQLREAPLEHILERLDEEYADPEGSYSEPTKKMREAERAFIDAVLEEYEPWMCEQVTEVKIKVLPWVREHLPNLLKDASHKPEDL